MDKGKDFFFEDVDTDDAIMLTVGAVEALAVVHGIVARGEGLGYGGTVGLEVARKRVELADVGHRPVPERLPILQAFGCLESVFPVLFRAAEQR